MDVNLCFAYVPLKECVYSNLLLSFLLYVSCLEYNVALLATIELGGIRVKYVVVMGVWICSE